MSKIGLYDRKRGVGLLYIGVRALGRLLWPEFRGQNDEKAVPGEGLSGRGKSKSQDPERGTHLGVFHD